MTAGFAFLISDLHVDPLVSSPTTIPTVSVPECEDKETHLKELQEEVLRLKNKMEYLLPSADLLPNFALKSQGAKVLKWMPYKRCLGQMQESKWFWFLFQRPAVNQDVVIQGHSHMLPGQCWAFAGSQGYISIALSHRVTISHVTLGHMPKILSPTGSIRSAPKEFSVYGKKDSKDEWTILGTFLYDEDGNQLQTFKLPSHRTGVFSFVKVQINSNWGHPEYTCLYNFRVHGKMEQ
ncbi:SUN domain-containing protein 3-like [Anableps anableps]